MSPPMSPPPPPAPHEYSRQAVVARIDPTRLRAALQRRTAELEVAAEDDNPEARKLREDQAR